MHTFQELQSGALKGISKLKLSCGLKFFPEEIFTLDDTLEVLDLSGNHLSKLPDDLWRLKKLRILFLEGNEFTVFPAILSLCEALTMVGLKFNKIDNIPENAFPPNLRWLVLTNNKITKLPASIGSCTLLQKCALAGNQIETLPPEMANCINLELLRISANKLTQLPEWLFALPRLSWLAFGGNPCSYSIDLSEDLDEIEWTEFEVQELLGEGASGFISRAQWVSKAKDVAVKVFKGAVTSDGLPQDEMNACVAAGLHENLVATLGRIVRHPEQKQALVFELIPSHYRNLGGPPSLITCTRDVFTADTIFSLQEVLQISTAIASVCAHLHERGILHGDLYAHNVLIDAQANALLGDFGAASFYDRNNPSLAMAIEKIEVRAFGCLLEDLLKHLPADTLNKEVVLQYHALKNNCMQEKVGNRPLFKDIFKRLRIFVTQFHSLC